MLDVSNIWGAVHHYETSIGVFPLQIRCYLIIPIIQ